MGERRVIYFRAHDISSLLLPSRENDNVDCSRCGLLKKVIRAVSNGDAAERVNRMNPAARLVQGDTKLIVSMRGNKTRARALSSFVWALGACKGMMQSRGGRGPAQSDDPPLPDTPGAQQLDTSLHAVPSMCPSATSPPFHSPSPPAPCLCLPWPSSGPHPAVSFSCIGAPLFLRTPPARTEPKADADAAL